MHEGVNNKYEHIIYMYFILFARYRVGTYIRPINLRPNFDIIHCLHENTY